MDIRGNFRNKKRIVVKVGSSSIEHPETGGLDYGKMEILVRELCDLKNRGMDVILVSSGAMAVGRITAGLKDKTRETATLPENQACAAIGQSALMTTYDKLFSEYRQLTAQVLITRYSVQNNLSRYNARNTFRELLKLGAIPVVNENDTVSTFEIQCGDNDTLSAMVANLAEADLLILLSDVDGLYTDDPRRNPDARFIPEVLKIDGSLMKMGKSSTGSGLGTGGMSTKLRAAHIAVSSGADMVIASGEDMRIISEIVDGEEVGTVFHSDRDEYFDLVSYLDSIGV